MIVFSRNGKGPDPIIEILSGPRNIWTDEPGPVVTPRDGRKHSGVYAVPQHVGVAVP